MTSTESPCPVRPRLSGPALYRLQRVLEDLCTSSDGLSAPVSLHPARAR